MIKVIEPPKSNKEIPKRLTCRNCEAVLEYMRGDLTRHEDYDFGGGRYTYNGLKCPCCGWVNKETLS